MEEKEQIMEILRALQEDVAALKAREPAAVSTSENDEKVNSMITALSELKEELLGMRENMDKSVDGGEKGGTSQTALPTMQAKGINAPGGMSTEQLQEFKKQTLQINGLQQKMKDLEAKLVEAISNIKKGNERAGEMEEKSVENVKDLYSTIDQINNSLSEKIAQQRVEMQKIAGDTPKAINYDPFNYGEAYTGDFVDFQARKRITEIKLLLQSLQAAMNTLRESVKVSPAVDLGYKVVRLDQLLAATGFHEAIETGEASHEDAVVITQPTAREPGRVEMPRKEMFQTSEEMESKWAITDSIMQTMYRLEIELGELQKLSGTSEASGYSRSIEELNQAVRQLRDKQMDLKAVKRVVDDCLMMMPPPARARQPSIDFRPQREDLVSRSAMENSARPVKTMQFVMEGMLKRLKELESNFQTRSSSAIKKMKKGDMKSACLSCDARIDPDYVQKTTRQVPRGDLYDPSVPKNLQALVKTPARSQYVISRTYTIDTSNVTSDLYVIPRPCGASYTVYWPVMDSKTLKKQPQPEMSVSLESRRNFVRGKDGHYYVGCDVPVIKSEFQKRLPVAVLKADVHARVCGTYKTGTGTKVARDSQYHGKQAHITTTVVKKETSKSAVPIGLSVSGEKKESSVHEFVKAKEFQGSEEEPPNLETNAEATAEPAAETGSEIQSQAAVEDLENAPVSITVGDPDVVVEENAEEDLEEREPELDNAVFLEEEDATENANTGLTRWKISQNDNNNANPRPRYFTTNTISFSHMIELMNAANSWNPKLPEEVTDKTNTCMSNAGAEVSTYKNVLCLPLEQKTLSFPYDFSDVRKSDGPRRNTGVQEYAPAVVANRSKYSDWEIYERNKQHCEPPRQQQFLFEKTPHKPSTPKQLFTPAPWPSDVYPLSVQPFQFQSKPYINSFPEQRGQQQHMLLPTSYHKAAEDKKILQLKLRLENEFRSSELPRYSSHQGNEAYLELPLLKHKMRIKYKKYDVICQQKPLLPRRGHSSWTNLEGAGGGRPQQEQGEKHRKLTSIGYWLDRIHKDQEDGKISQIKTKAKVRHGSCTDLE